MICIVWEFKCRGITSQSSQFYKKKHFKKYDLLVKREILTDKCYLAAGETKMPLLTTDFFEKMC